MTRHSRLQERLRRDRLCHPDRPFAAQPLLQIWPLGLFFPRHSPLGPVLQAPQRLKDLQERLRRDRSRIPARSIAAQPLLQSDGLSLFPRHSYLVPVLQTRQRLKDL